jgi:pyrroline-5-carboxylate reductase
MLVMSMGSGRVSELRATFDFALRLLAGGSSREKKASRHEAQRPHAERRGTHERGVPSPMLNPLAIIGGGTMGHAIAARASRAGLFSALLVAEPDAARHAILRAAGATPLPSAGDAGRALADQEPQPGSGVVLLAVKPQVFPAVASELAPLMDRPRLVLSIMAGVRSASIHAALGPNARVVRLMPNTPGVIGQGVTAISTTPGATLADADLARRLFSQLGLVVPVEEDLLDAFTALAGSGPAYVFYLAEAMVASAVELGFDPATASRVVRGVIAGAGALLQNSPDEPATLRAAVTSKGGTTQAACAVLDSRAVHAAITDAIRAGRDRARELSI